MSAYKFLIFEYIDFYKKKTQLSSSSDIRNQDIINTTQSLQHISQPNSTESEPSSCFSYATMSLSG